MRRELKENRNEILYKRMTDWDEMCNCFYNNIKGSLRIDFKGEVKKEEIQVCTKQVGSYERLRKQ